MTSPSCSTDGCETDEDSHTSLDLVVLMNYLNIPWLLPSTTLLRYERLCSHFDTCTFVRTMYASILLPITQLLA